MFQEDHRVGVADRRFQQSLGVESGIGGKHQQAGDMGKPTGVTLGMLGGDSGGGAIGAPENNRAAHLPARHIMSFCRRVDQMIHCLHGEIKGHELDNRIKASHRRANAQSGEAVFRNRRIDHAGFGELLQQTLGDFVRALVLRYFFAHNEDVWIGPHLLRHGVAQRFADGHRRRRPGVIRF